MTTITNKVRIHGGATAGQCICSASLLSSLDNAASLDLLRGAAQPARMVLAHLAAASDSIAALAIENPTIADVARRIEAIALLSETVVADPVP